MKAKYILEAIDAMKTAIHIERDASPHAWVDNQCKLISAMTSLKVYSGLGDIEITIEKEQS